MPGFPGYGHNYYTLLCQCGCCRDCFPLLYELNESRVNPMLIHRKGWLLRFLPHQLQDVSSKELLWSIRIKRSQHLCDTYQQSLAPSGHVSRLRCYVLSCSIVPPPTIPELFSVLMITVTGLVIYHLDKLMCYPCHPK